MLKFKNLLLKQHITFTTYIIIRSFVVRTDVILRFSHWLLIQLCFCIQLIYIHIFQSIKMHNVIKHIGLQYRKCILNVLKAIIWVYVLKLNDFNILRFMFCLQYFLFSSPEHEVLMVSYCGQWLSVVRRRPSSVVRRPSSVNI